MNTKKAKSKVGAEVKKIVRDVKRDVKAMVPGKKGKK
jgi:hypothetical protein